LSVPFTDQAGTKLRPAVVVSAETFHRRLRDVIVCPISSQPRYFDHPGPGDRPLENWKAARLRFPSTARVSNIVAIEKSLIRRVLGRLVKADLRALDATLREALSLP
jgi:mRNA-degrading endonuclease toxin of MazEF toxin-antitoxin module